MVKSRVFVKSKALLSRIIYLSHGILSVAMAIKYHGRLYKYWALFVPIVALMVESVLMLRSRGKWEFRYVSPAPFLYITTVVSNCTLFYKNVQMSAKSPHLKTFKYIKFDFFHLYKHTNSTSIHLT